MESKDFEVGAETEDVLDKERFEQIKVTAAHEAGHIAVAYFLGLEIGKVSFDLLANIKGTAYSHDNDETSEESGMVTTGGFVGEFLIMGREWMAKTGMKGMSGDRKMLEEYGFTKEKVDLLTQRSEQLLRKHFTEFNRLFHLLEVSLTSADKKYLEHVDIDKEKMLKVLE